MLGQAAHRCTERWRIESNAENEMFRFQFWVESRSRIASAKLKRRIVPLAIDTGMRVSYPTRETGPLTSMELINNFQ